MKSFVHCAITAAFLTAPMHLLAASDGEWWEMTTKVEMPGMPAMPGAQTVKFCRIKGDEGKPVKSANDKNCAITDVKQAGNTMTFNMKCTGKDAMSGSGEISTTPNSFSQKIKMRDGGDNLLMVSTGKRVGGACKV